MVLRPRPQEPLDSGPTWQDVHELVADTELPGDLLTSRMSHTGSLCLEAEAGKPSVVLVHSRALQTLARRPSTQLLSRSRTPLRKVQQWVDPCTVGAAWQCPGVLQRTCSCAISGSRRRAFPSQLSGFLVTCFKRAVTKGKHTLSIHVILYETYNIIDKTTNQQLQIKIFVGHD